MASYDQEREWLLDSHKRLERQLERYGELQAELKRELDGAIGSLRSQISRMESDQRVQSVKAGVWGALATAVPTLITLGYLLYNRSAP